MRGLCGTLTWNQHDDFTTPEGDVESSVASFVGKFTTEHCAVPRGAPPDPCTTYTQRRQYAETVCSVIHGPVFQVCGMECVRSPGLIFVFLPLGHPHVHHRLRFCRHATTWWRGSPISASVCQRFADVFPKGRATAPSSLPTPDTALRRVLSSNGATTPCAVSVFLCVWEGFSRMFVSPFLVIMLFKLSPYSLSSQRSSAQVVRCTRNAVVPVGAPVQMAGTAMMSVMEWVLGRAFQAASAHED